MVDFKRMNENGSIRLLGESPLHFEFRYSNPFYGICNFEACVRQETNRGLVISRKTIQVLSQEVRQGTEENLLSSAHIFFTRVVQGYTQDRLCEESRVEGQQRSSWGCRFRSAIQKWRDQFLFPVHSLGLSRPLEVKNKHNSE